MQRSVHFEATVERPQYLAGYRLTFSQTTGIVLGFTTTRPLELCLAVTKAISEELIDDCIFSFLTNAHTIIVSELSALFNFKTRSLN